MDSSSRASEALQLAATRLSELSGIPSADGISDEVLIRLNRAMALEAVAGGVIHDMRNPLQAVTMAAGVLAEGQDDSDVRQLSLMILEAAGQIENHLQRLVTGSVPPDAAPEPVALAGVVTAVAQTQRRRPEKGRPVVETHIPSDLPAVRGVEQHLRHALLNIVLNGQEALRGRDSGRLVIGAECHGDDVHLYVEDDGPGVPADIADSIFDPFFTTKGAGHLGLGLPVAAGLVGNWGGVLGLDAPSGGAGARFVLTLTAVARTGTD